MVSFLELVAETDRSEHCFEMANPQKQCARDKKAGKMARFLSKKV
jgi:hypothetical protein